MLPDLISVLSYNRSVWPQSSLRQAPKRLATELPFHLGHGRGETIQPGEGNTLMEAVGLLPQTGKGDLGVASQWGVATHIICWSRGTGWSLGPPTTAQSLWYDWSVSRKW